MAQDPESANPFAISDFWKPSPWLKQSPAYAKDGNPLFALDITSLSQVSVLPVTKTDTLYRRAQFPRFRAQLLGAQQ